MRAAMLCLRLGFFGFLACRFHHNLTDILNRTRPKWQSNRLVAISLHHQHPKSGKDTDRDYKKTPASRRRERESPLRVGGHYWRSAIGEGLIHRGRRID